MAKTAETEEVRTPAKQKKNTVTVHLPKAHRGQDNFQFVGVNGKAYKIMKGVDVEVPPEVAEVLANAAKMKEQAEALIDNIAR